MKVADTSLVVAAFASWHEKHEPARSALDEGLGLVDHCALETFSVLTRLPPPHRAAAGLVRDFLAARFPQPLLRLSAAAFQAFVLGLPERQIAGGATYDALVAATAAAHRAVILTCDRRAVPIYERYEIHAEVL
jgi:predicted nucleic acid-binding protein